MSRHPPPQSWDEHQPVPPDIRKSRQRLVEFLWSSRNACIPMTHSEARMQQSLQSGGSALYHQENELLPQSQECFSSDDDATLAIIAKKSSHPTWASQARAAELKALQGHHDADDSYFVPLDQNSSEMAPGKRRQQWKPLDLHQLSESTNRSDEGGKESSGIAFGGSKTVSMGQEACDANPGGADADTSSSNPYPSNVSANARSSSHLSDVSSESHSQHRGLQYAQLTSSRKNGGSDSLQGFDNPAVTQLSATGRALTDSALLSGQRFNHHQRQAAKPPSHYPAVKGTTGDKRYNQYRAAASGRARSDIICDVQQFYLEKKMARAKGSPSASASMNPEASVFQFGQAANRPGSSGTYASVAAGFESTTNPVSRDKALAADDGAAQFAASGNAFGASLKAQSGPTKQTSSSSTDGSTYGAKAGIVSTTVPRQNFTYGTAPGKSSLPASSTHHGPPQKVHANQPALSNPPTQPVESTPARTVRAENPASTRPVLGHSFGPITKRALDVVRGYSLEPDEEPSKEQAQGQAHGYGQGQGCGNIDGFISESGHGRNIIPEQGYSYGPTYGSTQVPSQQGPATRPALGRDRVQPVVSNLPNRLQPATLYGRRQAAFQTRDDNPPQFSANDRPGYMRAPPGLLSEDIDLPTVDNRHDQMWFYRDNRFSAETAAEITTLWNQAKKRTAAEKERELARQTKNANANVMKKPHGVVGRGYDERSRAAGGATSTEDKAGTKAGDKPSSQGDKPTGQEDEDRENALDVVEDLIMPVLANLREYMVGPRDYFTQNWTQPPEWCIDRSAAGLQSAFGDTWGTPPARVGRDPRYRSVQSDGRTPPSFNPLVSSSSAPPSGIIPVGPRQQQPPTQPAQQHYRSQPHRNLQYRSYQHHPAGRAWHSEESPSRRN